MTKKFFSTNGVFMPFLEEINKYTEGIHKLNNGVSAKTLEQLENQLNISLPQIYKEFLQICNGGELFVVPAGTIISEVYEASNGPKKRGYSYLDEAFNPMRKWPGMSTEYLIIADTSYGDTICLDLGTSNGHDSEVIKWSHEEKSVSNRWPRFIDWLMAELEIGSMLIDYDGNEKELDF